MIEINQKQVIILSVLITTIILGSVFSYQKFLIPLIEAKRIDTLYSMLDGIADKWYLGKWNDNSNTYQFNPKDGIVWARRENKRDWVIRYGNVRIKFYDTDLLEPKLRKKLLSCMIKIEGWEWINKKELEEQNKEYHFEKLRVLFRTKEAPEGLYDQVKQKEMK